MDLKFSKMSSNNNLYKQKGKEQQVTWLRATIFSGTLVFQRWHFGLYQIKGQRLPNASLGKPEERTAITMEGEIQAVSFEWIEIACVKLTTSTSMAPQEAPGNEFNHCSHLLYESCSSVEVYSETEMSRSLIIWVTFSCLESKQFKQIKYQSENGRKMKQKKT